MYEGSCSLGIIMNIFDKRYHTLLKGQQSEATNYSGSTIPANSTSVLIEEEKEEDEINATTHNDIKIEQLANASK